MIELNQFAKDDRVFKMNKLRGITEMSLDLNELDNSDNLKDGRPSNALLIYHVTANDDFTHFEPHTPQYKKLKNGEFVSLTLRITDQKNNIITDGPWVTVVLHVCDCKNIIPFKNGVWKMIKPRTFTANFSWNKRNRQKVIVTHSPSEIDQNQQLLVRFPNLGSDDIIIPGMANLSFNIELSTTSDPKRTLVSNIGRAIIKKITSQV